MPNGVLAGVTEMAGVPTAIPVPESVTVCGEPGALSVILMPPFAAPAAVGVNFTPKEMLCAGVSVAGIDRPLMEKGLPDGVAADRVTLTVPLFVSVTDCDALCPTVTLPKFTNEGVSVNPGCAPVPITSTLSVEFDASL